MLFIEKSYFEILLCELKYLLNDLVHLFDWFDNHLAILVNGMQVFLAF